MRVAAATTAAADRVARHYPCRAGVRAKKESLKRPRRGKKVILTGQYIGRQREARDGACQRTRVSGTTGE